MKIARSVGFALANHNWWSCVLSIIGLWLGGRYLPAATVPYDLNLSIAYTPTTECQLINIIKYCCTDLRDLFSFQALPCTGKGFVYLYPRRQDDRWRCHIPWFWTSRKIGRPGNRRKNIFIRIILDKMLYWWCFSSCIRRDNIKLYVSKSTKSIRNPGKLHSAMWIIYFCRCALLCRYIVIIWYLPRTSTFRVKLLWVTFCVFLGSRVYVLSFWVIIIILYVFFCYVAVWPFYI